MDYLKNIYSQYVVYKKHIAIRKIRVTDLWMEKYFIQILNVYVRVIIFVSELNTDLKKRVISYGLLKIPFWLKKQKKKHGVKRKYIRTLN